jgi:hypothetical protein
MMCQCDRRSSIPDEVLGNLFAFSSSSCQHIFEELVMKIWHIGALPSPRRVDGRSATIWQVAREQALLGYEVALLLGDSHRWPWCDLTARRCKTGFGVPIGAWLRQAIRALAEALLDEGRLRREGFFSSPLIREKWTEHLPGSAIGSIICEMC